ncbi:helix-turn-helix transcriptional regulator [Streptomyces phaeochromogenes]|uniref:helix-turn-helix domain-containing protein n=1 Tax=Streptomyces phaeochromogenes TaxID=1923 RepID=UPI00340703B7
MPLTDPALQRRKLRDRLRRLRESAGYTQRQVADEMEWSLSKIIRIETGTVGISITDLRALIAYYGVGDSGESETLIAMARAAKERPWWDRYKGKADPAFLLSLGYEGAASIIRSFEPMLVPGLLQTEEYALEVLRVMSSPEKVDALVELRLERQERLLRADGPEMHFIVDESVVARRVGSASVMRRQIRRLKALVDHPKIIFRVLPFGAGLHQHYKTPYVLYEFEDAEEDFVLYLEQDTQSIVREGQGWADSDRPARFLESFFQIEQFARKDQAAELLDLALSGHGPRPTVVDDRDGSRTGTPSPDPAVFVEHPPQSDHSAGNVSPDSLEAP